MFIFRLSYGSFIPNQHVFIVIGKPGAGKTSLVRRLAAEWKCELINRKWIIKNIQTF